MALMTATDLKARFPEITASDAVVDEAIALATEAFEHAADVAFSPTTETLTLAASDPFRLTLPRNRVTSVTMITGSASGSVALDGQIAGGVFVNTSAWTTTETLTVTVTHGYASPPREVVWAVGLLARNRLLRKGLDDRATQMAQENGGVINLATPGMFGSTFGIPDVDSVLARYRVEALAL